MDPGVRLSQASGAIEHQESQRVIRIVTVLGQQPPAEVALHGHETKRWPALMMLEPPCATAAQVAQTVKDDYSRYGFHFLTEEMVSAGRSTGAPDVPAIAPFEPERVQQRMSVPVRYGLPRVPRSTRLLKHCLPPLWNHVLSSEYMFPVRSRVLCVVNRAHRR
jgi:hypothetical protein